MKLFWKETGIPYPILEEILRGYLFGADQVFVKGSEKKKWLQHYVPRSCEIIEMYELGCPNLQLLAQEHDVDNVKRSMRHVCLLF